MKNIFKNPFRLSSGKNKWMNFNIYSKKYDAKFITAFKPVDRRLFNPSFIGEKVADFTDRIKNPVPELGVAIIKNGSIYRDGWIVGSNGCVIPEFSWYVSKFKPENIPEIPEADEYYPGTCINLCSTWSHVNHGHFLIDSLGRMNILQKAGFTLESSDYIYCAQPLHEFHSLLYDKLGLTRQNTIFASNTRRIKFDTIIAPSFPGIKSLHPPWIASFMRNSFLDSPLPDPKRLLYISRTGYKRQIINEKEVISLLTRYNFEIIDPLSVINQHHLFAEAKILISIHGSALANIVFCQPGTAIIDLMPEDHVTSFVYSLAESGGLKYYCIVCENAVKRPAGSTGPSYYDFYVDTIALENTLENIA